MSMPSIKAHLEYLYHYRCDKCDKWWSVAEIAPSLEETIAHCPHCGNFHRVAAIIAHALPPQITRIELPEMTEINCNLSEASDGYHTFAELYEHRNLLYLAFLFATGKGWKSYFHHDGSSYDGWFIVGVEIKGKQITYHLPEELWQYAHFIETYDRAPVEWDGHTSNDVIERLKVLLLEGEQPFGKEYGMQKQ